MLLRSAYFFQGLYIFFFFLWDNLLLGLLISPPPHPSYFPHRSPNNLAKIQTQSCHLPSEIFHITSLLLQCKPHPLWHESLWHGEDYLGQKIIWAEDSEEMIADSSRVISQAICGRDILFCAFPCTLIPVDSHLFVGTETFGQLIGECLRKLQWKLSFPILNPFQTQVRHCGFYAFMSLMGLKGKLAILFWKSILQNVLYNTRKRNGICQTDENTVNESENVLVTSIKMAEEKMIDPLLI